tara:strand:+ start:10250 stop:10399 length:150 start_codon:yes stop_codon:yes gene_type:complete
VILERSSAALRELILFLEVVNDAMDAVFEEWRTKIDQETQFDFGELQIR